MEHVQIAAREQAAQQYLQTSSAARWSACGQTNKCLQMEQITAQFVAEGLATGSKNCLQQLSGAGPRTLLFSLRKQELAAQKAQNGSDADNQIDQAKVQLDAQNHADAFEPVPAAFGLSGEVRHSPAHRCCDAA
jgi:hypothetical protein